MKKVYQLHLIANNKVEDHLFGTTPDKRDDYGAGWSHLSFDYKTLAEFVHDILHVNDMGGKDAVRVTITQYSNRRMNDKIIGYDCEWDATEEELEFINQGFTWNKKDRTKLVNFIVRKCKCKFEKYDKMIKRLEKSVKGKS